MKDETVIKRWPKALFIRLVRGYQYVISPLFPPSCRFVPTCSAYTIQAIEKYGVFRGGFLGICRILRCPPSPLVCIMTSSRPARFSSFSRTWGGTA